MITKGSIVGTAFLGIICGISGQWLGSILAIILLLSEWGHFLDRKVKDGYIKTLEMEIRTLRTVNLIHGRDRC